MWILILSLAICYLIYTAIKEYNKRYYDRLAIQYQEKQRRYKKSFTPKETRFQRDRKEQDANTARRDSIVRSNIASPVALRSNSPFRDTPVKSQQPMDIGEQISSNSYRTLRVDHTPIPNDFIVQKTPQQQPVRTLLQTQGDSKDSHPVVNSEEREYVMNRVEELKRHKPATPSPLTNEAINQSDELLKRKKVKATLKKKKSTPKPPGSVYFANQVRKGVTSVQTKKRIFEDVTNEQVEVIEKRPLVEGTSEDLSKKRKFEDDDMLKPEDGFTWIDADNIKAKKVKLDQETIVKKRIEYFKSLGMDVPQSTVPIPVQRVTLRTGGAESAKIELTTNIKPNTGTPLRKRLDDDELDEMTMKRLNGMPLLM
jgi:hypothetical protein